MTKLENLNYELDIENRELKESLLKLQSHSMKYNLIFYGIEQKEQENENTEAVLKDFIRTELEIADAAEIKFQNVHRLRKKQDGTPRSIIAKFMNYKDHERVRMAAPKLKSKDFSISQQYPPEINERRKQLYPKMKELQRLGKRANLVYDQLIVDGRPYDPTARGDPPPIHNYNHR